MELDQIKVAIFGIVIMEIAMGILAYLSGTAIDVGTIGMGIAALAGLAGYDMKKV